MAAGEVIAELSDNDPEILARIQRERDAAVASKSAAEGQVEVAKSKITALELSRDAKQTSAGLRVDMATFSPSRNKAANCTKIISSCFSSIPIAVIAARTRAM